jgi:hypothetical protein
MRKLSAVLLLLALTSSAFAASDFCGSDAILERSLQADPALRQRLDAVNATIAAEIRARQSRGARTLSTPNYLIPVIVYVVHNNGVENITDAQVMSQLRASTFRADCR